MGWSPHSNVCLWKQHHLNARECRFEFNYLSDILISGAFRFLLMS